MKRKLMLFLSLLFISVGIVTAQTQVSGVVVDDAGEPVIGATVLIKGTSQGTVTDFDGNFALRVHENATLVISYVGMDTKEVAARPNMRIQLMADTELLDEVIVVGYGTTTRQSFTGAASTISGESISKRPVTNISKGLSGASSGLQVMSSSGQPGQSATIRIRGVGSLSANQDPLIVLDGIPYDGSLASISANDIESLTVLKDAAANSMYGSRGSNGVIMITTKRGSGKPKVSFEIRTGFNQKGIPAYDVVRNPGEFLQLEWESLKNYAANPNNNLGGEGVAAANPGSWASTHLIDPDQDGNSYGTGGYNPYSNVGNTEVVLPDGTLNPAAKLMYQDDWMEEPFSTGFRQEYIASLSGAVNETSYYMSLGYVDDEAYIPNSGFKRYSSRVKVEQKMSDWFKMGMNLSYAKSKSKTTHASEGSSSAYANIFMFAQQIAPIYPIYQYDQNTGEALYDDLGNRLYDYGSRDMGMGLRPYGSNSNPLATLLGDVRGNDRDMATATAFVDLNFLNDFKFTGNASVENSGSFINSFQTPIGGDALNVGGRNYRTATKYFAVNTQQLLNWTKTFNHVHNINVLAGHEFRKTKYNELEGSKEMFLIPGNPELSNAARVLDTYSLEREESLDSWFARAEYNYDNKYYLTSSFRADASSKFHPDNRWGNFWAIGASWRMEKEDFLKDISAIDMLKLKASYGTQGNDGVLDPNGYPIVNAYSDQYDVINLNGEIGLSYIYRGNPNLTWEASSNFNAGVDFGFFNRVRGTIDYYSKETKDLLYRKPLPGSMGNPSWIYDNSISMKNSGFELDLNVDVIKNKDLLWTLSGNITYQKNKLTKLPLDRDPNGYGYRSGSYFYKVGGSIYDFYMYEFAGVDPETGKTQWWSDTYKKDANGENEYDSSGELIVESSEKTSDYSKASYRKTGKSALPDWYGGIGSSLSWNGFDLFIQTAYQIGGYGIDTHYRSLMNNMSSPGSNVHKDVVNKRWQKPGDITDVARLEFALQDQNANSDNYLTSKSSFSIQNITLGYNLPDSFVSKLNISRIRIYASGDNLYLFSARKGFDPRQYFSAGAEYNYSAMRTITFGINLDF